MKKFAKHARHYLPLVGILAAGFLGFILFSYDQLFQVVLIVAVATAYVGWGIIHHHIHDDLDLKVIIEYIAIATLGLVVVFSLLFRA